MRIRFLFSVILFFSVFVSAQPTTEQEIQHLLNYVKTTPCQYERNGDLHAGKDAIKHIQKKYDYFEDEIQSSEDFIKYSATKSTISGRKYHVICKNKSKQESAAWLLEELKRFRAAYQ